MPATAVAAARPPPLDLAGFTSRASSTGIPTTSEAITSCGITRARHPRVRDGSAPVRQEPRASHSCPIRDGCDCVLVRNPRSGHRAHAGSGGCRTTPVLLASLLRSAGPGDDPTGVSADADDRAGCRQTARTSWKGVAMTAHLVRAAAGDTYDHLGLRLRVRLTGQDTAGSLALIEHAGRRGAGTPLHRHTREAETFIVLDGDLDGWSDENHTVVSAGDTLYLPRAASTRIGSAVTPRGSCCSSRQPVSSGSSPPVAHPATAMPNCRPYPVLRLPRRCSGSRRYSATTGCPSPVLRRLPDVAPYPQLAPVHRATRPWVTHSGLVHQVAVLLTELGGRHGRQVLSNPHQQALDVLAGRLGRPEQGHRWPVWSSTDTRSRHERRRS